MIKPQLLGFAFLLAAQLPLVALAQEIPLSKSPSWQLLKDGDDEKVEFEKNGIYRKGKYTYVAVRSLERADPRAYAFMVQAFDCKAQRVAGALMGVMHLDGVTVEHAALNPERILDKYNDPVSAGRQPYIAELAGTACKYKPKR